MNVSNAVLRILIQMGRTFQPTRLARARIGQKTVLEHMYLLSNNFFRSPQKIITFWHDTMFLPKGCPFSLLILNESTNSKGSTYVFRQNVTPGMTVVDVGAHIGYYTLQGARLVGNTGRVYAFEPNPENYALLTKNVEINGCRNVVCIQQGISEKPGMGELFLSRYSVSHSMSSSIAQSANKTPVKLTSLDEFFQIAGWPPVDFIKMNIEGWEYYALKGMEKLAGRSRRLRMMLEYHPNHLLETGVTGTAFLDQIANMGFEIYLIDEKSGLQSFNETTLREGIWSNIYCQKG